MLCATAGNVNCGNRGLEGVGIYGEFYNDLYTFDAQSTP